MLSLARLATLVDQVAQPQPPRATYRLQFHAGFTFADAEALVPYLHDLGISHIYASPYLRARSGSTHGYDVADPNALNPELGSEEDYRAFVAALRRHGMGQILDIVPNHMGIGYADNFRWWDVLENGPSSVYAPFFDITWQPLKAEQRDLNKLVLPTLGDQYGKVLENGELAVRLNLDDERQRASLFVQYYENRFPVAPDTYPLVLQDAYDQLEAELGRRHEHVMELASILTAMRHLPSRDTASPDAVEERNREKEMIKRRLYVLYQHWPPLRDQLERTLASFNGMPGDGHTFDALDGLLNQQSYRLAFWRVAAEEINYRRFFDINELAAVRMEDPRVFAEMHRLLFALVGDDLIQGLRVDHPDGLRNPAQYLWRLQRGVFVRVAARQLRSAHLVDDADLEERLGTLFDREWARGSVSPRLRRWLGYVVVEKILEPGEDLPPGWPVAGTTGYDFLNAVNRLFVARDSARAFDAIYARFSGSTIRFADLSNSMRKMIMLISLAGDASELGYLLHRIAERDRRHRDFTLANLGFAIREVIASLPVYRTYVDPETGAARATDAEYLDVAVADAKRRNPRTDPSVFDFVRETLLSAADCSSPEDRDERLRFIARFQQTSGPVMAKGVEDTAFYRFNRLISLNEVGGDPDLFGATPADFHGFMRRVHRNWPNTMLATSTHDTKRGEDVRARINVLSELPREWRTALTRWSRLNSRKKSSVGGAQAPDRNDEYLLYQALLGVWPFDPLDDETRTTFAERIVAFMLKSVKEAKVHTSWINPNEQYENAVEQFVRAILNPAASSAFLEDFAVLQKHVAYFGVFNSLSQTLLKLASPGVPDIYQGNDVWDFSLVDPDNRRPVDYARRAELLRELCAERAACRTPVERGAQARSLVEAPRDGRAKLFLTHLLLRFRADHPGLFKHGSYEPLRVEGAQRRHVVAFARVADGQAAIAVAPVLVATLTGGAQVAPLGADTWHDTRLLLPPNLTSLEHVLTGDRLPMDICDGHPVVNVADVLRDFPVALLHATAHAGRR